MMISNTISIVIYSYHQDGVFIKSACQKQLINKKRRDCREPDDGAQTKKV